MQTLASSGIATPFSRAIASANDTCAGLGGLGPVSPVGFLSASWAVRSGACKSRNARQIAPDFVYPAGGLIPSRRAIEAANFFIAAVGGRPSPFSLSRAIPSSTASPARAPSPRLPMMRRAASHTASIAPIISCLPVTTSSSRHSSSAVTPGSTKAGSARSRTSNSASRGRSARCFVPGPSGIPASSARR